MRATARAATATSNLQPRSARGGKHRLLQPPVVPTESALGLAARGKFGARQGPAGAQRQSKTWDHWGEMSG
eukprot:scaffold68019_cov58-Phaeocystis_antarctica.AAC.3